MFYQLGQALTSLIIDIDASFDVEINEFHQFIALYCS